MLSADSTSSGAMARIQPGRPSHQLASRATLRVTNTGSSSAPTDIHDQGVKCA